MESLTAKEQGKLKEILAKSSQLQTADNRIDFIMSCGLHIYLKSIQIDKVFDIFFTSLIAVFCTKLIKTENGEEKLALVIFLEYFIQLETTLSTEDKDSIEYFIQKYQVKPINIPKCPYRGLSAFTEKDEHLFFGREEFVQQLVDAVKQHSLVPVIGASGSGKSSVVLAGLIPRLRAEGTWLIESFRPQSQPFYGLASALVRLLKPELDEIQQPGRAAELVNDMNQDNLMLSQVMATILERNPGKRILLVIDQFEELYSLCRDEKERQRFLDQLLSAVDLVSGQRIPSFSFVFTLRADFYSYMLSYRGLVDAALGKFILPPLGSMIPQELQATIEKPVENLVELESGLTERILEDVAAEPGNLPLLEFALTQLWQTQRNGKLTHAAYLEMGGVKQALANHAEVVYSKLSWTEQEQAQRIFVQLVRPGEGTEDTRRLATRAEVGEENWALVQEFAGESVRLVVTGRNEATGEETVEVVHEALIKQWQSLRDWMKGDRIFRTWQERLRTVMRQWESSGNDDGVLLRGFPLNEAADWLQQRLADMSVPEREFIRLSVTLREKDIKERENQKQLITIARTIAIGLAIIGVILIFLLNRTNIIKSWITVNKKHLADRDLANYYLPGIDLSAANLSKANLQKATLEEADLSKANLQRADLRKTYMKKANFSQADLSQANLSGNTILEEADLSKANLSRADLRETYMKKANFSQADLSQADLSGNTIMEEANLSGANLQGTNLEKTHLVKSKLLAANLSKANLREANLQDADISGANLQGAKNLNPDQVKRAKNWDKAKYDADFSKKLGLKDSK
ncbi:MULTISPECIES: pentapeptide repeat-containing protein [unclassified Microcoleus]|uniref:nSTAND1 domain-containing NTPase n=1 Tax=unclassified Microcoleus TaxID=2642155 RepID=UPI001D9C7523|nr:MULTISPECIES: pentapeptide repeat-containing protein [unclassified Microcoleus]MCC3415141.1 pentapeptide repeat-containing protein [Microcoleus sp. PH2017_02_FOX_O_A]MCC3519336.1 pentapeptide repeat-containing protein [Microcoleus sp. PH2017_18_LLB_O_A]MCC3601188.1 pentapeptide repeat-containing protein [Microcoleus sp. PH2017_26_ELK_O_A]MCC3626366.1 pentapeptide repeat-containing protein [Microcoleus sp. PH2017_36_ELK_O_B]